MNNLEAFISNLKECLPYISNKVPDNELKSRQLREQLNEIDSPNFNCSEQNVVKWLRNLEASIRESNYDDVGIYETLCSALASSLKDLVKVEEGSRFSPQAIYACKECVLVIFEKIWGTNPAQSASPTNQTEQQQSERLERFKAAFGLLLSCRPLFLKESVFSRSEAKHILTRTAELLNFSPLNSDLASRRLEQENNFFSLVAGQIIPYIQGQEEIDWQDQISNYPNAFREFLRKFNFSPDTFHPQTGLLIEKFLAVFQNPERINKIYEALQTQASGSQ